MNTEIPTSETETNTPYLTPEMFENLQLLEKIEQYAGGGATSFLKKHDTDKIEYMESWGIDLYKSCINEQEEVTDRAILGTTFKVLSTILAVDKWKKKGGSILEILPGVNLRLEEQRIARYAERASLDNGERFSDCEREKGGPGNPTLKVTREELQTIIGHVFEDLSKKELLFMIM